MGFTNADDEDADEDAEADACLPLSLVTSPAVTTLQVYVNIHR